MPGRRFFRSVVNTAGDSGLLPALGASWVRANRGNALSAFVTPVAERRNGMRSLVRLHLPGQGQPPKKCAREELNLPRTAKEHASH